MAAIEIHVRGAHTATLAPERGTLHASLSAEGPQPEPVFAAVTAALVAVQASIEELHHPKRGPVTWYSVDQIRMGSRRPWHKDGKPLPPVYSATVSVAATFRDFAELARWVSWSAGVDGLSIGYVDWDLTEANRNKVERSTRQKAVRDAQRRAQDYADALDLGKVAVRAVSDPGVGMPRSAPRAVLAKQSSAAGGEAAEFALRPEDVAINAEVEATFVVHGK
ncbi:SIMPL domain-containing protein [Mycobacterium sp. CVI_P3]|uniref:SIMPL domain-containing protein n=1 Tax=Mycobacterium pinniadriaticum TaxID=2994102 RepID=A0ABT3SAK9_9MYCO|nr:SIMPL domain-containing protein [Mycobacterium pinniadriaticum]MCX2929821.1 SIMPL domain-containing protein [Mycobacterium pinniadriaticum]MCX2936530.1 SIMPL domain-containing protein [Mycobacterium pinniadriaticum]